MSLKKCAENAGMWTARSPEGKGVLGCLISLTLLCAAVFVSIRIIPVYYAHNSFEMDVKTEISRAGARFYDNEVVVRNVLDLAKRNEILLARENVKVTRFAGRVQVTVRYSVPVDFMFYERNMDFTIKASSFVGTL